MALFQVDPDSVLRPYLKLGGRYGTGQPNGGVMRFINFVPSCRQDEKATGPGLDRECEDDDYSRFMFEVIHPDMGRIIASSHQPHRANSGSKLLPWLANMGYAVTDRGEFDPDAIKTSLPRDCIGEFKAPRQDKNDREVWYTGDIIGVYGL